MTPEEDARAALRAKYAAEGAFIDTTEFKAEDYPVTFATSVEGLEGTGKTHLAVMTFPTPLVVVNFGDRSVIPFLYDMPEERRKLVHPYDIKPPTQEGWDFKSAVASLVQLGEIIQLEGPLMRGGTFLFDGGSSWWGCMQQVFVEPKEIAAQNAGKKKSGFVYEEANGRVRGVLKYLSGLGCFLVITHQLKQDWAADGPIPGQFSPRRNSQVPYLMEVVIRLVKVCATCNAPNCQNPQHVGRKHMARLEKLAGNTGLEGLWVENLDFDKLYTMQTGKPYVR